MNVDRIIDEKEPENDELEYKHPEEESADLAKELAAFANTGGGTIIIGVVEKDGVITNLISAPHQELEERINQTIGTRLSPEFQVNVTEYTYSGERKDWHGTTLVTLNREGSDRLHSFQQNNKYVIPVRQGSTTRYASGQEIALFYERGIHPGRGDKIRGNSDRNSVDLAETFGEVANNLFPEPQSGEHEESTSESTPEDDPDNPSFDHSDPPYYFTPTETYDAVTFHSMMAPYQPHGFEGVSKFVSREEVTEILAALQTHFDVNLSRGKFTISQRNGAWFGVGAGNFLAALDQEDRYETIPQDFELDTHHSEGTIFISDLNHKREGQVIVRARDGIRSDVTEEFSVNFLTSGIPIDNRQLTAFLDETSFRLYNGQSIPMQSETLHPTGDEIPLTPIDRLESRHEQGWVGGLVCENPFYDDPSLLENQITTDNWKYFEPVTKYEQIYCRLSDHHPMTESREYHLRRGNLQSLTEVQGSIPHMNASLIASW